MTRDIDDGWKTLHTSEPSDGEIDEVQKVAEKALEEPGSIASKRLLGQIFERELDELHTPEGSSYFSEKHEDRAEEERKRREERYLMAEVVGAAKHALAPWGMRVETGHAESALGVVRDGEYVLRATDREGRVFDIQYGLGLAEKLVAEGGKRNLVERMGQAVAQSVLEERKKYLDRMH